MSSLTFSVPDMTCAHCESAVSSELLAVPGVASVYVDLGTKLVFVRREALDEAALRDAIDEAGYTAQPPRHDGARRAHRPARARGNDLRRLRGADRDAT